MTDQTRREIERLNNQAMRYLAIACVLNTISILITILITILTK